MREMVDVKKAAEISGMSVSWWRQKILRKQVPFYKVARRVLINRDDISRLLDRCRVEPQVK
jgi:hypothetical protein